jgi:outer membrane protein TolC
MTQERAVREADATGQRLANDYWQRQTGRTNTFDLARSADALTLRIALLAVAKGEQNVVFPAVPYAKLTVVSNAVLTLSLADALSVAARNDRRYQKLKDDVFFRALDLDYQQYLFRTSFSGQMLAMLTGDPGIDKASGRTEVGFQRALANGTDIAGRLALDVVKLLRDDWRSTAFTGDLTVSVPLLRGSGRDIVLEPLTQAERNLIYALRTFEGYRQSYAVAVASSYYRVLELSQRYRNARENERRLSDNSARAEMMFEAGRMQRIQVDQARTDLLKAGESVISSRKSYEAQLDGFKMAIGLPPTSQITPDQQELTQLEGLMAGIAKSSTNAVVAFPDEAETIRIALAERHDMFVARGQLEDTARGVKVAADALRADVALNGGLSANRKQVTGGDGFQGTDMLSAGVTAGFPWNRRKERNAFKKQMLSLEQAKRTLEEQEDNVRLAVRNGLRNLIAARASYQNQVESLRVALLRVESNDLYQQSGRSTMRDVLEAESAMLTARNAFCSALILWWISDLELRRDMGVLEITEAGMWLQVGGENHG